ncbi:hypothetical protein STEG23_035807, partial [Scotinomys teguina]
MYESGRKTWLSSQQILFVPSKGSSLEDLHDRRELILASYPLAPCGGLNSYGPHGLMCLNSPTGSGTIRRVYFYQHLKLDASLDVGDSVLTVEFFSSLGLSKLQSGLLGITFKENIPCDLTVKCETLPSNRVTNCAYRNSSSGHKLSGFLRSICQLWSYLLCYQSLVQKILIYMDTLKHTPYFFLKQFWDLGPDTEAFDLLLALSR